MSTEINYLMTLTGWILKTLRGFDTPVTGLNLATLKSIPRLNLGNLHAPANFHSLSDNKVAQLVRGQMHKNEENITMKTAKGVGINISL